MWLINAVTLQLEDFSLKPKPRYAILSHTWGDEEVTFRDMANPRRHRMKGFFKISQTCKLALDRGLFYAWVDTCCIDKSSSAELTEAINSMFQWYQKAELCFAYLSDFEPDGDELDHIALNGKVWIAFSNCRWWTRGWTLQELFSPNLEFYDQKWQYWGSRDRRIREISKITGISDHILSGELGLESASVAARMSWAANRETTRPEDEAYCLFGIFGVNMPLIYGEGRGAFRRLLEAIVSRTNDLTVLACETPPTELLPKSPRAYSGMNKSRPSGHEQEFRLTNRGLLLCGSTALAVTSLNGYEGSHKQVLSLSLGTCDIRLGQLAPKLYYRLGQFQSPQIGKVFYFAVEDPYIALELDRYYSAIKSFMLSTAIPGRIDSHFMCTPHHLWDRDNLGFYLSSPLDTVFCIRFELNLGWDKMNMPWFIYMLADLQEPRKRVKLFLRLASTQDPWNGKIDSLIDSRMGGSISWPELEEKAPEILELDSKVKVLGLNCRNQCILSADIHKDWKYYPTLEEHLAKRAPGSGMCIYNRISLKVNGIPIEKI